ncbi:hypothetical protein SDC9_199607 [bioreactor metagenome]|uniref:Uncharacterized protein n=1 Tax=bioreactor metagenome TaxID=1076179 RepID=A0A645ILP7_9ZZZZ
MVAVFIAVFTDADAVTIIKACDMVKLCRTARVP